MRLYEDRAVYVPLAPMGTCLQLEAGTWRVKGLRRWWVVRIDEPDCQCREFRCPRRANATCRHIEVARRRAVTPPAPPLPPTLKLCCRCGRQMDVTGFSKNHPRQSWCFECQHHYNRARHLAQSRNIIIPGGEHLKTPKAEASPTVADLHWIAGFLEGEGCFMGRSGATTVCASQTVIEPLQKLQRLLGGNLRPEPRGKRPAHWKPSWRWSCSGVRALGIALTVYSLMSPRRQEKIRECLHEAMERRLRTRIRR